MRAALRRIVLAMLVYTVALAALQFAAVLWLGAVWRWLVTCTSGAFLLSAV